VVLAFIRALDRPDDPRITFGGIRELHPVVQRCDSFTSVLRKRLEATLIDSIGY